MSSASRVLTALLAGLLAGAAIAWTAEPKLLAIASAVEPLGTLWLNAIRSTVIPLVVSLLISRIASQPTAAIGRVGGRGLLVFALFAAGAAIFAAVIGPPVVDRMRFDQAAISAARAAVGGSEVKVPAFRDWLTGLMPTNAIKAAADDAMLPLIVFTILFACGVTRTSAEHRDTLVRFFAA